MVSAPRPFESPASVSPAVVIAAAGPRRPCPIEPDDVPRAFVQEITRPIAASLDGQRGPDYRDLARLDAGLVTGLPFACGYRLDRRIGKGGMSVVYAGHDLEQDRPVAIKILAEDQACQYPSLARFYREPRLGMQVDHVNVVQTLSFGSTPEGLVYLVLERLDGEDLEAVLSREHTLPWPRARDLMLQICAGLAAIHAAGLVHRDIKPSNCFCVTGAERPRLKLIDFGIATEGDDTYRDVRLDDPQTIVGTPRYMSPEQARGDPVDIRSDVYSAGIILCELLTGTVPYRGRAPVEVLDRQIHAPVPSLRSLAPAGVDIDPAIESVFRRAVAKDPDERFTTIAEMARAIEAVDGRLQWRRVAGGVLGVLAALGRLSQT